MRFLTFPFFAFCYSFKYFLKQIVLLQKEKYFKVSNILEDGIITLERVYFYTIMLKPLYNRWNK